MLNIILAIVLAVNICFIECLLIYGINKKKQIKKLTKLNK